MSLIIFVLYILLMFGYFSSAKFFPIDKVTYVAIPVLALWALMFLTVGVEKLLRSYRVRKAIKLIRSKELLLPQYPHL